MKKVTFLLALFLGAVSVQAQPTPQDPSNYMREQRAYEKDQRTRGNDYELSHQWTDQERRREARRHARWCNDWRERVQRHPRLLMPRSCWRQ